MRRRAHDSIEYGWSSNFERLIDIQYVCGRRLLSEGTSRVRVCGSSSKRVFSMAITAWLAKLLRSSICLSVNGRAPVGRWRRRQ